MRTSTLIRSCNLFNSLLINHARSTIGARKFIHSEHQHDRKKNRRGLAIAAIGAAGLGVATLIATKENLQAFSRDKRNSFRIINRKEVSEHNSLDNGVWITYKGGVYDITNFVKHHPGGSQTIMMGAGGDVEPFWETFAFHKTSEVQNLLAQYQIGVLPKEEQQVQSKESEKTDGPYANDPIRNPLLNVLSSQPFNAETPSKLLIETPLTPNEIFFVRNHLPVPEVDLKDYKLSICLGTDGSPDTLQEVAEFTLDDLKNKFPSYTIESIVQCSGNRRSDLKKIKEIKGLDWKVGAIGNAKWTGVKLVDLLESLNLNLRDKNIKHIQAEGLDCDLEGKPYGASISADVALDPNRDVLLAYEMNGQPLSRDHGFPLRFVAPGITGARNVKWLSKIILSNEESNSHWQRKDYKSFSPNIDMFNLDYSQSISIQEMPVQSAICTPVEGDKVTVDPQQPVVPVKGYAYSGGGKMVIRVDVSVDGGKTWLTAQLDDAPDYTNRNRTWSWTRWHLDVPVPSGSQTMEILCRAFDSAYNSQPERAETVWNVRGVVNNSWHKINIGIVW